MEKTLGLLLMIGLGLILQRKISSSDQLKGIKVVILCVALPATIFVALLKVELSGMMLALPLLALLINIVLLVAFKFSAGALVKITPGRKRTLMMLLPSLAPGLSCFPFISEYLGDESLALAALADVGNKLFVLIFLYLLAMHWYYKYNSASTTGSKMKLKSMIIAMISEPINLVMMAALALMAMGINLSSLPESLSLVILRLSSIMAPLILLFIGLAVRINRNDFAVILRLLSWRSGLMLIISGLVLLFIPSFSTATALLIIVLPQSSCSFWPFAHMNTVQNLENEGSHHTFDTSFALSLLACSLPFSTLLIMGVFSFESIMINPVYTLFTGFILLIGAFVPYLLQKLRSLFSAGDATLATPQEKEVEGHASIAAEKILIDTN
ncbi:MAG: permease [Bacteroidota bacterium]